MKDLCEGMRYPLVCPGNDEEFLDVQGYEDCPEHSHCCLANCNKERFNKVCGRKTKGAA